MNGLDLAIFRAINGWPDSLAPFFVFLSEATKRPGGLILLGVVFIGTLVFKPTRKPALLAMLAWPIANATTDVFKYVGKWPRPSWPEVLAAYPEFVVRVDPLTSFGTASAHSANMMAIAACFLWCYRPLGFVWLGFAILTGLSRIYVGVHWPSQVLLGWLCGAFVGTVVIKTWEAGVNARKSGSAGSHPEELSDQHSQETPESGPLR